MSRTRSFPVAKGRPAQQPTSAVRPPRVGPGAAPSVPRRLLRAASTALAAVALGAMTTSACNGSLVPVDAGSPSTDGDVPSTDVAVSAPSCGSLAAYCSQAAVPCAMNWDAAVSAALWCAPPPDVGRAAPLSQGVQDVFVLPACGSTRMVVIDGLGTNPLSTALVYDSSTGALVGVADGHGTEWNCVAGSPGAAAMTCSLPDGGVAIPSCTRCGAC
jgi:hypothetical protein